MTYDNNIMILIILLLSIFFSIHQKKDQSGFVEYYLMYYSKCSSSDCWELIARAVQ